MQLTDYNNMAHLSQKNLRYNYISIADDSLLYQDIADAIFYNVKIFLQWGDGGRL